MTNFQISKLLLGCLVVLPALAWAGTPAASSTMVPRSSAGNCPGGTNEVGAGYCQSTDGRHFMPISSAGNCPGGANNAGADYCRADEIGVSFVPISSDGNCPSGATNAGADYCRVDK